MDPPEDGIDNIEVVRRQSVDATRGTHDWAVAWEELHQSLKGNWETTRAKDCLDALIGHHFELAELAPLHKRGTMWMAETLSSMAVTLSNVEDQHNIYTENILLLYRQALAETPTDMPVFQAQIKSRIAEQLLCVVDASGDDAIASKTREAADVAEDAAKTRITDDLVRSGILGILGRALRCRFRLLGGHGDLERSVWATRGALEALGGACPEDPNCGVLHQNLANGLNMLFDISGDLRHLDESIEEGHKSLQRTSNGVDKYTGAHRCCTLADSLTTRARLNNSTGDLNTAVSVLDKALQYTKTTAPEDRSSLYEALARTQKARYDITNHLDHLDSAIKTADEAVALFGQFNEPTLKASVAHLMTILYTHKYRRSKNLDDALEGLEFGRKSLEYQGPGARKRGEHLGQMAILYETMFHFTRSTNEQIARGYLEQALSKAAESLKFRPNSAIAQNNMANKLLALYDVKPSSETLTLALKHVDSALSATEDTRVTKGSLLSTAGRVFKLKYEAAQRGGHQLEADEYLTKAADSFSQAAQHPESLPLERIQAARRATELLSRQSRWETAYELLHEAMSWVAKLCPIHMSSEDQRRIVTTISGLAAEACSVAITCGKVKEAIMDLEKGRGIFVASAHKAIPDVDKLRTNNPDLFERYCYTRDQLLGISRGGKTTSASMAELDSGPQQRLNSSAYVEALNTKMDGILREIRSVTGLGQFLEPIMADEMQELCGNKPVVALNASPYGAHAIFVTRQRIWSIPLPDPPHIPGFAKKLSVGVRIVERIMYPDEEPRSKAAPIVDSESSLLGLLSILWHHIAGPVAKELGFDWVEGRVVDKTLLFSRRILWLPGGHYSRLPIHAAGLHSGNGRDTLMAGRGVVSSYIASFRMLRFSQNISVNLASHSIKGLILSMEPPTPSSTGSLYLEEAGIEAENAIRESKATIDWEVMRRPTNIAALNRVSGCSWLHVASHAVSDTNDPSASFLCLQNQNDEDESSEGSHLTIQQISELQVDQGIVAYLSACSTAESRVGPLLDENLSIAYAFQVAGFPHVVGSLWPANEVICPDFAAFFYRYLVQYGSAAGRPLSSDLIAFCVHYATVSVMIHFDCIREKEPSLWAGFVHIGP